MGKAHPNHSKKPGARTAKKYDELNYESLGGAEKQADWVVPNGQRAGVVDGTH